MAAKIEKKTEIVRIKWQKEREFPEKELYLHQENRKFEKISLTKLLT